MGSYLDASEPAHHVLGSVHKIIFTAKKASVSPFRLFMKKHHLKIDLT